MAELQLQSTLTCPHCGYQATETMPTDACVAVYDCKGCGAALRPLPGSCCVFCSYGSVPCPPIQQGVEPCCTPLPVQGSEDQGRSPDARAELGYFVTSSLNALVQVLPLLAVEREAAGRR